MKTIPTLDSHSPSTLTDQERHQAAEDLQAVFILSGGGQRPEVLVTPGANGGWTVDVRPRGQTVYLEALDGLRQACAPQQGTWVAGAAADQPFQVVLHGVHEWSLRNLGEVLFQLRSRR